jgi:hypothetical protein
MTDDTLQEQADMTGAIYPTDLRPVVALFCTRGMGAFLSNAIEGLLRVGIGLHRLPGKCAQIREEGRKAAFQTDPGNPDSKIVRD